MLNYQIKQKGQHGSQNKDLQAHLPASNRCFLASSSLDKYMGYNFRLSNFDQRQLKIPIALIYNFCYPNKVIAS